MSPPNAEKSAPKRRRPKQARAKAKYDAILRAGLTVLLRDGYAAASTAAIADEAGVSIGTLYAYFADKEEIFSTFVEAQLGEIMNAIAANVSLSRYDTAEAGIRDIITTAVRFTQANKPTLGAMVGGRIPGVYDGMMLQPFMDLVYEVAEAFFRAHGLVQTSEEARRVTYTLTGAVAGFFIRMVTEDELPFCEEVVIDELVALVMGYMGRYAPD